MTSTIKVNTVTTESGSTLTLGESGKTVTLASGASQTGFGRTGTVDWQTSIKTTAFTAVSGEGYFCDTNTSGAFTVTLPASPSAGDIVAVKDYANTFDTANLTIGRNGSNIGGAAQNSIITQEGIAVTLVYADSTKGWLVTESGLQSEAPGPQYVAATGGTVTTACTDFKVHTFTSPGTFLVSNAGNSAGSNTVDYLVVAGGGGGGGDNFSTAGGGGGAGGFRYSATTYTSPSCAPGHPLRSTCAIPITSATGISVTVGGGGAAGVGSGTKCGTQGSSSIFSTITSAGGGYGNGSGSPELPAGSGGSGGGARNTTAGNGNTPPVTPSQGNPGGLGNGSGPTYNSGGGGGAMAAGSGGSAPVGGGPGGAGAGLPTAFGSNGEPSGSFRYYSGGGGGGIWTNIPAPQAAGPYGQGGLGGGGCGGQYTSPAQGVVGVAGTANTGGGGGAASGGPNSPNQTNGGAGGSGIVVIRYKFQNQVNYE